MDFLSTSRFQSKLYPDVSVTIRQVTMGRQMEIRRRYGAEEADGEYGASRAMWNGLILDFDGLTVDGLKPSIDEFFLNGPPEVVNEISSELVRLMRTTARSDEQDERIIEEARRQITEAEERMIARRNGEIAEAQKRIAERKNSEPQSFTPISDAETRTAADASEIPTKPDGSEKPETAAATQASSVQ